MWNGSEKIPRIYSLYIKNVLLAAKFLFVFSTVCLASFYGFTTCLLVTLLSLAAYHLPVVLVFLNDIHLGHVLEFGNTKTIHHKAIVQTHEPYYLIEGDAVPLQVNEALEKFFNALLDKYVLSWQTSFKVKEEKFILELRHIIKFFIIQLHQRLCNVDLSNLVIHDIVPLFIWHAHCYSVGTTDNRETEKYVLSCFGDHLHPAINSRKTEETYLRNLSQKLVKILLPPQLTSCHLFTILTRDILSNLVLQTALDVVADPDTVNKLLILALSNTAKELQDSTENVNIFENFTKQPTEAQKSYLYPNLSEMLKTPSYLYHLMQFMKRERSLKYLQFIFAVDEFNEKLLNPDLCTEQMQRLQTMGRKMFEMYFRKGSPDSIGFSNDSVDQMESIVNGDLKDIIRLRTSPTLFQAYEHVIEIMEKNVVPRFYRSSEFYRHWLGSQSSETTPKSQRRKAGSTSSGWLKKLRTAITPNWLGADAKLALMDEDLMIDDTGVDLTEASVIPDDEIDPDEELGYVELPTMGRNLSSWRTSIPKVVSAVDSSGRPGWAFEVEIQRLDLRPGDDPEDFHWTVARTYNEFYVLETKLTEFHGDLAARLPPKKMFGTRDFAFLQSIRLEFEAYLRVLLTQPALKGSDLVFSFLTLSDLSSCHEISGNNLNLLPNIGLGRMLRNVPMKLRKERGQDLDSFVQTLIASTLTPKPKPKLEPVPPSEVSVPVIKQLHPLYKDNVKSFLSDEEKGGKSLPRGVARVELNGAYDCLLFLVMEVWRLPRLISGVLLGLQSSIAVYFNTWSHEYVSRKLSRTLHPSNVSAAINLIHETVIRGSSSEIGLLRENQLAAWNLIKESTHSWLDKILGRQMVENRLKLLFQCLQYPILNKQLSYMMFDTLLAAAFPEVFEDTESDSELNHKRSPSI